MHTPMGAVGISLEPPKRLWTSEQNNQHVFIKIPKY